MASALGDQKKWSWSKEAMVDFKEAFNQFFWDGHSYKSPYNMVEADDRAQALAVVSGLVDADQYDALYKVQSGIFQPLYGKVCLRGPFSNGSREYV